MNDIFQKQLQMLPPEARERAVRYAKTTYISLSVAKGAAKTTITKLGDGRVIHETFEGWGIQSSLTLSWLGEGEQGGDHWTSNWLDATMFPTASSADVAMTRMDMSDIDAHYAFVAKLVQTRMKLP